jgi:hypothetical protein
VRVPYVVRNKDDVIIGSGHSKAERVLESMSREGIISVVETWADGRQVRYEHTEYDCEWCGEYFHTGENCPNTTGDDDESGGAPV